MTRASQIVTVPLVPEAVVPAPASVASYERRAFYDSTRRVVAVALSVVVCAGVVGYWGYLYLGFAHAAVHEDDAG